MKFPNPIPHTLKWVFPKPLPIHQRPEKPDLLLLHDH
jgi:hypothetical protein